MAYIPICTICLKTKLLYEVFTLYCLYLWWNGRRRCTIWCGKNTALRYQITNTSELWILGGYSYCWYGLGVFTFLSEYDRVLVAGWGGDNAVGRALHGAGISPSLQNTEGFTTCVNGPDHHFPILQVRHGRQNRKWMK